MSIKLLLRSKESRAHVLWYRSCLLSASKLTNSWEQLWALLNTYMIVGPHSYIIGLSTRWIWVVQESRQTALSPIHSNWLQLGATLTWTANAYPIWVSWPLAWSTWKKLKNGKFLQVLIRTVVLWNLGFTTILFLVNEKESNYYFGSCLQNGIENFLGWYNTLLQVSLIAYWGGMSSTRTWSTIFSSNCLFIFADT